MSSLKQTSGMHIVPIALATRTLIDTCVQMFYPFALILSDGFNITPVQFGYLISLRSLMGLASPLFGEWTERSGYKIVLLTSLACISAGSIVIGATQGLVMTVGGVMLLGLGLAAFVPTLQAFASETLHDAERARGMGIIEYGWALSSIVGLFAVGRLIELTNWRVPFFVLGGLLAVMLPFFGRIVPATSTPKQNTDLRTLLRITDNPRGAWGMIIVLSLVAYSAMHTFVAHGLWLSDTFALAPSQLGTVALLLGIVDLCGSGSVSLLLDRIGRQRSLVVGGAATAFAFLVWGLLSSLPFVVALAGMLAARFGFEFCLVSGLITLSEQSQTQRAKVVTISAAVVTLGIAIAGITGPTLYARFGAYGLALPSAIGFVLVLIAASRVLAK